MHFKKFVLFFLVTLLFFSCKKTELVTPADTVSKEKIDPSFFGRPPGLESCDNCSALSASYKDSTEQPAILGSSILNLYTLPNMTQAYTNINGHAPSPALTTSHLYVKFSPANLAQLALLEDEDIDLSEFPFDKEVFV